MRQYRKQITRAEEERCLEGCSAFFLQRCDSIAQKVATGSRNPSSDETCVSVAKNAIGMKSSMVLVQ
jgi:hypothetical protein